MYAGCHIAHAFDCHCQPEQSHRHGRIGAKICCELRARRPERQCSWMKPISSSTGQTMLADMRREVPNLFVARTFSKAYGLAGSEDWCAGRRCRTDAAVRRVSSPYNVNARRAGLLAGGARGSGLHRRVCDRSARSRARLEQALEDAAEFNSGRARRISCLVRDLARMLRHLSSRCGDRGILVRDRSSDPGLRRLCPHHNRPARARRPVAGGAA